MQQFHTLRRLLFFYILSLLIMLMLHYSTLFSELQAQSERHSVRTFEWLQHEMVKHAIPSNHDIDAILRLPFFEGISYQLILMLPSGQTYVHNKTRVGEDKFTTIAFPVSDDSERNGSYQLSNYNLTGVIELDSGHKLYVVLRHKPLDINWVSYHYWLPLMAAIGLFMMALFYMLKRCAYWEQLLSYTENLTLSAKDSYTPPPFITSEATPEFLRLGHALSHINFKLHNNYRRIKTLNHRLERLVDQSPLPMLMLMRKGEVSFFNQRFEQIFATVFIRDVHYSLTDFVVGGDKTTQQLLQRLSAQRVSRTLLVTGLENKKTYQLHLTPWFGEHGQVHGFTVLLNSVEKLIQQSANLQYQNQQLQLHIKELDKLRFIIGHELRTPLSAIISALDLLKSPSLSTAQQELLTTLSQSSHSMLTMLNDMLDMAKIEAGKAQIVDEPADIYKMGQHISDLMVGRARQQKIELHYLFIPDCPRYINTDVNRLQQILLNLLDNAIKFTPSGHVTLLIEAVTDAHLPAKKSGTPLNDDNHSSNKNTVQAMDRQSDTSKHHWVCFRVIDTGIGIESAEQQQLFSYFNQANDQISRRFGGTGLGLAISNSFAHLLDGFIEVDSDGESGSTFTLYLPCRAPSYLSMYHTPSHISCIQLIAFTNLPLWATYFSKICQHLTINADIYHADNLPNVDHIRTRLEALPPTSCPILLLDYEYYAENIEAQQDFEALLLLPNIPKILISMKPERSIPAILFDRVDGFLNKPIDISLLLSELIRLTKSAETTTPAVTKKPITSQIALPPPSTVPNDSDIKTTKMQTTDALLTKNETIDNINTDNNTATDIDDTASRSLPASLILIVEDNLTNQKITSKLLSKLGFESIIAENGEHALKLLAEHRSDIALILMDCRMPVMDGLEATRAIRAQGDDITIIALTANNSEEDKRACENAGMNAFLGKPIQKDKLETLLKQFLVG